MHKKTLLSFVIICTISLLCIKKVDANNIAAGDISYEWQSDSTYRFFVKLYRDCSGNIEPSSVPLCFYSPCNKTLNFSTTLTKVGSATTFSAGCSPMRNQCDSPQSTLPGYQEVVYSGTATLPAQCNAWHIFSYVSYRNASNNILNATATPLYLEARFNNTGSFQGNSSSSSFTKPIFYAYKGRYTMFNNMSTDPDMDSIVTEVIDPQTGVNSCADTVPGKVTYATATPGYNITSNPFQTNSTFGFNASTKMYTFTPAQLGKQTVSFRIREYRKGVLIGYTTREVQLVVFDNPPQAPKFTSSATVVGCLGQPVSFSWSFVSPDPYSVLVAGDNHGVYSCPGSTVYYTREGTDSVHGTFNWTPTASQAGLWNFQVYVIDSTCRPPGIVLYYPYSITLNIFKPVLAPPDTSICLGDTATLSAAGGGTNVWSIIPGGSAGSLACASCSTAKAYPTTTTSYQVINTTTSPCPVNIDTMTVTVRTNLTYPWTRITVSPDSNITPGTTVTFTANTTNCLHTAYQWKKNGTPVPGAVNSTYATSALKNNDVITCELICNDTCPKPRDTMSNPISIHINTGISKLTNDNISIYPNPNNGSFTVNAKVYADNCKIEVLNTVGQTLFTKTVIVHNNLLQEQLKIDVPAGIYLLKLNNEVHRFVVNDR